MLAYSLLRKSIQPTTHQVIKGPCSGIDGPGVRGGRGCFRPRGRGGEAFGLDGRQMGAITRGRNTCPDPVSRAGLLGPVTYYSTKPTSTPISQLDQSD